MKKYILLSMLIASASFAGTSAYNTTQRDAIISASSDGVVIQGLNVTNAYTSSFSTMTNYSEYVNGGVSSGSTSTGVITTGRAGKAVVMLAGSFTASATGLFTGEVFTNGVTTGYGFDRNLTAQASAGSYGGMWTGEIASGSTISFRIKSGGATGDIYFTKINFTMQWID